MQLGMVDVNIFARRHWKISIPERKTNVKVFDIEEF